MKSRRKSIRLSPDEDQLLRTLHRQSGVPDGQFAQRPKFWRQFTNTWNEATERRDTPEDILHYIMTRRKRPHGRPGRWDAFGDNYQALSVPEPDILTPEQWAILSAIYVEMRVAADNFLIDRDLRKELLRRFVEKTGAHIPELLFTAALIARRKGGLLPKTGAGQSDEDIGFGDINEVA